ncbi:MAG: YbaN family protein [Candidatus Thiodiazotropha sp. (ex Troendleina suluensis)]|nr:YbaN family protein [Candidatus Thiodiazotropha sp. (ex Troendleina suluensis)]
MFIGYEKILQNYLLIIFGWLFTILGIIGALLPVLPTTPFLIVALAFFSKSSPRFHKMLLNNIWFGPILKQWEDKKTLSRQTKYKAYFLIIITFSISTAIINNNIEFQLLLVGTAIALLFFIWRIKEEPLMTK